MKYLISILLFVSTLQANANSCYYDFQGEELQKLIYHSDPARLSNFSSAQAHVNVIADILVEKKDYRGIFALFYKNILASAIPSVVNGDFQYDEWADQVSLNFVKLYLENLHNHLTGKPVTFTWAHFYRLAGNCEDTVGRVAMSALTAHIVMDFPEAINDAKSTWHQVEDFYKFGDLLTSVTKDIAASINEHYDYDLAPFFNLYFLGQAIDGVTYNNFTSTVFFQSARTTSWINGMRLREWWIWNPWVRSTMFTTWMAAESALDEMTHAGLL